MIIIHSPSGNSTWQWQIPVFTWDAYSRMKFEMMNPHEQDTWQLNKYGSLLGVISKLFLRHMPHVPSLEWNSDMGVSDGGPKWQCVWGYLVSYKPICIKPP